MKLVIIIITRNVFSYQNLNKHNGTDCKFDCFFFFVFLCVFFNNHLGFHLIIEIFLMLNNNDGNVQSYFKKKFEIKWFNKICCLPLQTVWIQIRTDILAGLTCHFNPIKCRS